MLVKITIEVKPQEQNLLEEIRKVSHGEVVVFIQDHLPVRIERVKESIKL